MKERIGAPVFWRQSNQILSPEGLVRNNFALPGRDEPIPLGVTPVRFSPREEQRFRRDVEVLAGVNTKALAFALRSKYYQDIILPSERDDPRTRERILEIVEKYDSFEGLYNYLERQPTLQRPDFLVYPLPNGKVGQGLLEFNSTRPGGIILLNAAAGILQEAGVVRQPLVPRPDMLLEFFERIRKMRGLLSKCRVGLLWSRGYVAEIEMPRLAEVLNREARRAGSKLEFFSAERNLLEEGDDGVVYDQDGSPVEIVYENAAPPFFRFKGSDKPGASVLVNPPIMAIGDNKALIPIYRDSGFQEYLTTEEKEVIERRVPPAHFVSGPLALDDFIRRNPVGRWVFKVTDGIKASSGKGIDMGSEESENWLRSLRERVTEGVRVIAQQRIPPKRPWCQTSFLDSNGLQRAKNFLDCDPYVVNCGDGNYWVIGYLSRGKSSHPINVSQGGSLGVVERR